MLCLFKPEHPWSVVKPMDILSLNQESFTFRFQKITKNRLRQIPDHQLFKALKMRDRQRRPKRQRTIALIIEYNSCTLECSELITCLPSSSVIAAESSLLGFCGQRERQTTKFDNLCLPSRLNLLHFSVRISHAKSQLKIYR